MKKKTLVIMLIIAVLFASWLIKTSKNREAYKKLVASLTPITESNSDDTFPVFSSDGHRIAYLSGGSPTIISTDGTARIVVPEIEKLGKLLLPHQIIWSPDGRKILFCCYSNSTFKLGIFDLFSRELILLDGLCYGSWWAKDVIVAYDVERDTLLLRNIRTEASQDVLDLRTVKENPFMLQSPFCSSNSQIYCVVHFKETKESEFKSILLQLTPQTGKYKVLVDNGAFNEALLLSPKEDKLCFITSRKGDLPPFKSGLFTYDLNTGKRKKIRNLSVGLCWSPDDKMILCASGPLDMEIFIAEVDTGKVWLLSDIPEYTCGADWSADGKTIALSIPQRDTNDDGKIDYKDNKNIVLVTVEVE